MTWRPYFCISWGSRWSCRQSKAPILRWAWWGRSTALARCQETLGGPGDKRRDQFKRAAPAVGPGSSHKHAPESARWRDSWRSCERWVGKRIRHRSKTQRNLRVRWSNPKPEKKNHLFDLFLPTCCLSITFLGLFVSPASPSLENWHKAHVSYRPASAHLCCNLRER